MKEKEFLSEDAINVSLSLVGTEFVKGGACMEEMLVARNVGIDSACRRCESKAE